MNDNCICGNPRQEGEKKCIDCFIEKYGLPRPEARTPGAGIYAALEVYQALRKAEEAGKKGIPKEKK